ncbi:receptor-type tyrosine-protein phosphatase R [Caerostris extrusa]|uniref:protein-tyrosine-phosphatase n=1 Tax=Caerostris extrusa TaxID=172846 RepID=A0AAV4Q5V4_CAEEX|nr:receptor-type tyrosine-protein phosphatase R [Caerostris extrusa]
MFTIADSSPKMNDDDIDADVQESFAKRKLSSSDLIDKLIPEKNKLVFTIKLRRPMLGLDVVEQLTEAVAEHANLEYDSIKVTKYEPYLGMVKMFFVYTVKEGNNTEILKLRPVHDILEHLTVKKRLQNAGAIKILDINDGDEYAYHYPNGRKISVQSIFSDKNWEAWQLAVVISASLFALFFIFVIITDGGTRRVIVQPVLRPVVAGVGVIQPLPENRERHIAAIDTDSEHTPSPSRSPMRRGRGLLERRGSNASLTLDLNRSQENIHCGTPPKECSAEEFLQSATKRITRRQLRLTLKDVKALHTEFWEIPMNHPERVEIAGSGTKNRYKTILPNETTRVHLYERSEDPLSSYINANYIRGYGEEAKLILQHKDLYSIQLTILVNDLERESPLIVMITKLKEKMKVKFRELFLRRGSETHTVHHFWYTTWPDHKTPATAKATSEHGSRSRGYEIREMVHWLKGQWLCIAVLALAEQVVSLLLDRGGMIQTAEQYEFVHQALSIFELSLPGSFWGLKKEI